MRDCLRGVDVSALVWGLCALACPPLRVRSKFFFPFSHRIVPPFSLVFKVHVFLCVVRCWGSLFFPGGGLFSFAQAKRDEAKRVSVLSERAYECALVRASRSAECFEFV